MKDDNHEKSCIRPPKREDVKQVFKKKKKKDKDEKDEYRVRTTRRQSRYPNLVRKTKKKQNPELLP